MENSEKKDLEKFSQILGIDFANYSYLKNALVHRSYLNENKQIIDNNERLEFLGDAVLELIITQYLYKEYPQRPEGELTSFRAAIVRTESLAETANELEIGNYIFISKGEEMTGGRTKPYILANTYEAILGAIYLDQGFEKAEKFVHRTLTHKIPNIVKNRLDIDSKSKLQELSQEILSITPAYELLEESGPDHDKSFIMQVVLGTVKFGSGQGKSKQEAEERVANFALENWDTILKQFKKNTN
jgi:ribonuclease III